LTVYRNVRGQSRPHWPAKVAVHLDAGYDSAVTRRLLDELGLHGQIARKGVPAPIQVGKRWVCERTHSWMNGYGNCAGAPTAPVRSSTSTSPPRSAPSRALIREARARYRWHTRPTSRRLT
jgi:hypothetical protein